MISYYDLLLMIKENRMPTVIEVELTSDKRIYTMALDLKGNFSHYELKGEETENYYTYLSECFLESMMFDKVIKILDNVLTKKETDYLLNVISPFKKRIKWIGKEYDSARNREFIMINLGNCEFIKLPFFIPKEYYRNMVEGYQYTLEELKL